MIVNNGVVEMIWVEPGLDDNAEGDPFQVSDAHTMLKWLEASAQQS
jgi:peroxiredoxin